MQGLLNWNRDSLQREIESVESCTSQPPVPRLWSWIETRESFRHRPHSCESVCLSHHIMDSDAQNDPLFPIAVLIDELKV